MVTKSPKSERQADDNMKDKLPCLDRSTSSAAGSFLLTKRNTIKGGFPLFAETTRSELASTR